MKSLCLSSCPQSLLLQRPKMSHPEQRKREMVLGEQNRLLYCDLTCLQVSGAAAHFLESRSSKTQGNSSSKVTWAQLHGVIRSPGQLLAGCSHLGGCWSGRWQPSCIPKLSVGLKQEAPITSQVFALLSWKKKMSVECTTYSLGTFPYSVMWHHMEERLIDPV